MRAVDPGPPGSSSPSGGSGPYLKRSEMKPRIDPGLRDLLYQRSQILTHNVLPDAGIHASNASQIKEVHDRTSSCG